MKNSIYDKNIIKYGGMNINTYIINYFNTYNFISWKIGEHVYKTPEYDQSLKNFCEEQQNLLTCIRNTTNKQT